MASFQCTGCGRTDFFTSHGFAKHGRKCKRNAPRTLVVSHRSVRSFPELRRVVNAAYGSARSREDKWRKAVNNGLITKSEYDQVVKDIWASNAMEAPDAMNAPAGPSRRSRSRQNTDNSGGGSYAKGRRLYSVWADFGGTADNEDMDMRHMGSVRASSPALAKRLAEAKFGSKSGPYDVRAELEDDENS